MKYHRENITKITNSLLLFILLISVLGCSENEPEETDNLNVEKYIKLLKSNEYDSIDIPAFTISNIKTLLEYRNDTSIVNNFPNNPISSFVPMEAEYELRVLVLWTIESIRIYSINSQNQTRRFPSLNPFLQIRDSPSEWLLDYSDNAYDLLSETYNDWWLDNENKSIEEMITIDPLSNTKYEWH